MAKLLFNTLRLLRPRQWIKNFFIFASIVFGGELFNQPILSKVVLGFVVFCLLSSATYIINDLYDLRKDRLHPFKKFRPLAHGDVPIYVAISIAAVFVTSSLFLSILVTPAFF